MDIHKNKLQSKPGRSPEELQMISCNHSRTRNIANTDKGLPINLRVNCSHYDEGKTHYIRFKFIYEEQTVLYWERKYLSVTI
jgi:hypothetical protein